MVRPSSGSCKRWRASPSTGQILISPRKRVLQRGHWFISMRPPYSQRDSEPASARFSRLDDDLHAAVVGTPFRRGIVSDRADLADANARDRGRWNTARNQKLHDRSRTVLR